MTLKSLHQCRYPLKYLNYMYISILSGPLFGIMLKTKNAITWLCTLWKTLGPKQIKLGHHKELLLTLKYCLINFILFDTKVLFYLI